MMVKRPDDIHISEIAALLARAYLRLTLTRPESRQDSLAEPPPPERPCVHVVNTAENPERKERA